MIEAVVFDLGGVVMDSPLHAIARYERDHGLLAGAINRVVVDTGETGAWSRLERGELTQEAFFSPFEDDCRACGVELSGARLMAYIAEAGVPRPRMLEAIRRIRARGCARPRSPTTGCARARVKAIASASTSTCSWSRRGSGCASPTRASTSWSVASSVSRRRARRSSTTSAATSRPRALGMSTIKVDDPDVALRELGTLLGFDLLP
jgi:putative hydrolase of the HAD superfamily